MSLWFLFFAFSRTYNGRRYVKGAMAGMTEHEGMGINAADKKARIRERYKGISEDALDVIPALKPALLEDDAHTKRVAVYARVSTDDPRQTSSYELQKNHYQDVVSRHIGWELIGIYADEGISGTSLLHRDSFLRMIEDCKEGKIDLILTKSVSRFARNIVDCISYIRQLRAMKPPIGVMFETEHIYTLDTNSDMSLAFIATLAQEESHTKSEIMNSSIEMRFRRGIFLTPPLLGYDLDEDGNLVINEEEARTVRLIFFMYLYGYTCQQIADQLTSLKRRTKKGNTSWSASTVLDQLQNERHCGDVLSRKTWTPNYLDHKSKKNRQDRNQYLQKNHHEAIISRDDFIAVQHLLRNARYKNKGLLPQLTVIREGLLTGFVSVNPRWSGFKAADYRAACESANVKAVDAPSCQVSVRSGDFDLRGYEIARSQFFESSKRICITFGTDNISFSSETVRKLESDYIELLVHPLKRCFAIRPCRKDTKNALRWIKHKDDQAVPRKIYGSAFIPNLYDLFGWNHSYHYRIGGFRRQKGKECIIIFDLEEMQALIPRSALLKQAQEMGGTKHIDADTDLGNGKHALGYPPNWMKSFSVDYYRQAQMNELMLFETHGEWNALRESEPISTGEIINTTSPASLIKQIDQIISQMSQEEESKDERTASK